MSVNKVRLANGETIIDISDSTVTPETLAEGATAYDASGQKITGQMVPGGGASVQSDWNQTDESSADFIKNKPFGDVSVEIMSETEVVGEDDGEGGYMIPLDASLFHSDSETLTVTFDGNKFECMPNTSFGIPLFGNTKYFGGDDTGEPFLLMLVLSESLAMMLVDDAEPHTVGIETATVQKIQPKYVAAVVDFYAANLENGYLYTDINFTAKVTAVELISAARNFSVRVAVGQQGLTSGIYTPIFVSMLAPDMYSEVTILVGGERRTYYTAEYTP